jgi:hypothetical protein
MTSVKSRSSELAGMDPQAKDELPEHDFEPVFGLPEVLPPGEFIRWQGQPDWRDLALSMFHVRKLAVYFLAILAIRLGLQFQEGALVPGALSSALALLSLSVIAIALLILLAWLMARATSYTITNKRLVIRSGVAVSLAVNLPFEHVVSADFRERKNGFGDIPVLFDEETRPSWIILWPHVRPWHFGRVQPMLRSLPNAARAAEVLASALREYSSDTASDARPVAAPKLQRSASMSAHRELGHV